MYYFNVCSTLIVIKLALPFYEKFPGAKSFFLERFHFSRVVLYDLHHYLQQIVNTNQTSLKFNLTRVVIRLIFTIISNKSSQLYVLVYLLSFEKSISRFDHYTNKNQLSKNLKCVDNRIVYNCQQKIIHRKSNPLSYIYAINFLK